MQQCPAAELAALNAETTIDGWAPPRTAVPVERMSAL
jgi:hypothetical protein